MGRHDDVRGREERARRVGRVGEEDVGPVGPDLAGLQRLGQVLLDHHLPAGRVDQDDAVLHLRDGVAVDHPLRLRREREVDRDVVGPREQLVVLLDHLGQGVVGEVVVVRDDRASRRPGRAEPPRCRSGRPRGGRASCGRARSASAPSSATSLPSCRRAPRRAGSGSASIRAIASSATATDEARGVFLTSIPFSRQASMSTLSSPTPPRMTSFRFGAPARYSRVTLDLDRIRRTSASRQAAQGPRTTSPKAARRPGRRFVERVGDQDLHRSSSV